MRRAVRSPRTRGWSPCHGQPPGLHMAFPAYAGVVRARYGAGCAGWCVPRVRGGGPASSTLTYPAAVRSPRTRGWSPCHGQPPGLHMAFPAYAGVVRARYGAGCAGWCVPRVRGGGPASSTLTYPAAVRSPRTRGWSPCHAQPPGLHMAFPAYAGVVRARYGAGCAGWCVPRVRGGGPASSTLTYPAAVRSPRTRGWSRLQHVDVPGRGAFPAYAGVVPARYGAGCAGWCVPRVRGGGPASSTLTYPAAVRSPRTRGWSRERVVTLSGGAAFPAYAGVVPRRGAAHPHRCRAFPAYAGVVPCVGPRRRCCGCVPRVRGGGPRTVVGPGSSRKGSRVRGGGPARSPTMTVSGSRSPRTRGWSPNELAEMDLDAAFPAYAGWSRIVRQTMASTTAFPAYAGVVPYPQGVWPWVSCVPRVRGGGPICHWPSG